MWGEIRKQARGTVEDAEERGFHTHTLLNSCLNNDNDSDNARSPQRFF